MDYAKNLDSKKVFEYFEEISKIPRGTDNEKGISDYLVKFAKDKGLDVWQDDVLNVIIHAPGTAGYENSEPVIIQGHMDMVCEKNKDVDHDFLKDPLKLRVVDGYLMATGTTLGADNGIAIAYGLALIDSDDIPHPPIELLITVGEEVTMVGAENVTGEHLSGKIFLNVDTEEEGLFYVSCAGGSILHTTIDAVTSACDLKGVEVSVKGLTGGHSGLNIIDQRANSIKLLFRLLKRAQSVCGVRIAEIHGGSKHNAIPREAHAVIGIEASMVDEMIEVLSTLGAQLKDEFRVEDPQMEISVKAADDVKEALTPEVTENMIDFYTLLPNGVQTMSKDIEGLVQTSCNVGVLQLVDGKYDTMGLARSASKSELEAFEDVLFTVAKRCSVNLEIAGRLVQWEYEKDSEIRPLAARVYREMYGEDARFDAVHAGLECGLLKGPLPQADMISFGPNIIGAHSPEERVEIASVERVWAFIKALLKEFK